MRVSSYDSLKLSEKTKINQALRDKSAGLFLYPFGGDEYADETKTTV